jgi:hypothetical protein
MYLQNIAQDDTLTAGHPGRTASRRASTWTGRFLSTIAVLFLTLDSVGKLLQVPPVIAGTTELGYRASVVFPLGVLELLCVATYVFPPTSVLGALLLTGYLGGAIATHLRVGNPLLTHMLFPIYVALFVWGGLFLREPRLRALLPWRR